MILHATYRCSPIFQPLRSCKSRALDLGAAEEKGFYICTARWAAGLIHTHVNHQKNRPPKCSFFVFGFNLEFFLLYNTCGYGIWWLAICSLDASSFLWQETVVEISSSSWTTLWVNGVICSYRCLLHVFYSLSPISAWLCLSDKCLWV